MPSIATLAQNSAKYDPQEVFFWLGLIVVASGLLAVIALWLRKVLTGDIEPGPSLGFSLSDLREMHAQGQLSDEEFVAAKAKMLARSRQSMDEEEAAKHRQEASLKPVLEDLEPADDDPDTSPPADDPQGDPGNPVDNPQPDSDPNDTPPDKNGGPPV